MILQYVVESWLSLCIPMLYFVLNVTLNLPRKGVAFYFLACHSLFSDFSFDENKLPLGRQKKTMWQHSQKVLLWCLATSLLLTSGLSYWLDWFFFVVVLCGQKYFKWCSLDLHQKMYVLRSHRNANYLSNLKILSTSSPYSLVTKKIKCLRPLRCVHLSFTFTPVHAPR